MFKKFIPEHINATSDDLSGNHGIGRYVFLPGSDGRAQAIAALFEDMTVKNHPRAHNLYLGKLRGYDGKFIDVATIATGMGGPSIEIILHELFHLGAKRFLRVGTAGSLQPNWVKTGDLVNAQAAVRDENTATNYAPLELPAIASLAFINAIETAAKSLQLTKIFHSGIVHCKSALYAREFGEGPRAHENHDYIKLLTELGVLASEMETATLFVQSQVYQQQLHKHGMDAPHQVLVGAILAVVGAFEHSDKVDAAIQHSIEIALESVKILAKQEAIG